MSRVFMLAVRLWDFNRKDARLKTQGAQGFFPLPIAIGTHICEDSWLDFFWFDNSKIAEILCAHCVNLCALAVVKNSLSKF